MLRRHRYEEYGAARYLNAVGLPPWTNRCGRRRAGALCHPGCVTDKKIRALLASVEPSPFIDRTHGTVALLRSRVEAAGADVDAVVQWVEAKGGHVDRTQAYRVGGRGHRFGEKLTQAEDFYVVPTEALAK